MENVTSSATKVYLIDEVNLTIQEGEWADEWPEVDGQKWVVEESYDNEAEAYTALLKYINDDIKALQEEIDYLVLAKKRVKQWFLPKSEVKESVLVDVDGVEIDITNPYLEDLVND